MIQPIQGLQMTREAPPISHLFFVNHNLLYGRANPLGIEFEEGHLAIRGDVRTNG